MKAKENIRDVIPQTTSSVRTLMTICVACSVAAAIRPCPLEQPPTAFSLEVVLHRYTKFEVHRPSCSEDMADFWSQAAWWLWPFHLRTGAECQHGTDDLPVNFGVSVTFHCQAMDQHSSDWWYDLTTFIFDVTAHAGDARHCTTSLYQVWRSLVSPYGRYGTFSVSVLISPETLTFDRSLNGVTGQLGHELHSC